MQLLLSNTAVIEMSIFYLHFFYFLRGQYLTVQLIKG